MCEGVKTASCKRVPCNYKLSTCLVRVSCTCHQADNLFPSVLAAVSEIKTIKHCKKKILEISTLFSKKRFSKKS